MAKSKKAAAEAEAATKAPAKPKSDAGAAAKVTKPKAAPAKKVAKPAAASPAKPAAPSPGKKAAKAGVAKKPAAVKPAPAKPAELEAHLHIADKTVAEFIIDKAREQKDVDQFKKVMHSLGLGGALNDALVERFWAIIMALTPGGATSSSSAASTATGPGRPL
ncbi:uncharacterized protein HaLaN_08522, partial [Haematococcus lacustris]